MPSGKLPKFLIVGNTAFSLLNFRSHMLQEVENHGYEIHCVVYEKDPIELIDRIRARGWKTHKLKLSRKGMNPFHDLFYFLELRKLITELRPQSLFCYTIKPVIYGGLARIGMTLKMKSAAMITGLGYAFIRSGWKQRLVESIVTLLYRASLIRYDEVIFQNPDDRALFEEKKLLGTHLQIKLVAGSGISLEDFPEAPLLATTPLKFLMVARVLKAKGVYEYLEAAGKLKAKYTNSVCFEYLGPIDEGGDGIPKTEFLTLCHNNGVNYLGETTTVRPFLEKCHVFVLPSYREGLPRSTLEAMAVGRAIVTTNVPGCRETVSEGKNGFFSEARDAQSLERAIEKLYISSLEDSRLLVNLGIESRKMIVERFDVRVVNKDILEQLV